MSDANALPADELLAYLEANIEGFRGPIEIRKFSFRGNRTRPIRSRPRAVVTCCAPSRRANS